MVNCEDKIIRMWKTIKTPKEGARGVMVIIVGNGPRRHEFKSWTRLIAFHIALKSLGKV